MINSLQDIEMAAAVVAKFYGPVESAPTRLVGGTVNKSFVVHAAGRKFVVRFQEDPARFTEYSKEKWCVDLAHSLGVPTVEVLEMGKFDNVVFVIQSFIEGRAGTERAEDAQHIWSALGKHLSPIHSIKTKGSGLEIVDPEAKQFSESWDQYLTHNITILGPNDELRTLGYINGEESDILKECFEGLEKLPLTLGLCHGDVALRNTIIDPDGKVHLIDWGCAHSDVVPFSDFANILRFETPSPQEFDSFLDGYGLSPPEFAEMRQTIMWVGLLRATDNLRWAIAHGHTANRRYRAGLRWALKIIAGEGDWFTMPYSEAYADEL